MNQSAISIEEVREAVKAMKLGKAPGLSEFPVECLKKECIVGDFMFQWSVLQYY